MTVSVICEAGTMLILRNDFTKETGKEIVFILYKAPFKTLFVDERIDVEAW